MTKHDLTARQIATAVSIAAALHGIALWQLAVPQPKPIERPEPLRVKVLAAVADTSQQPASEPARAQTTTDTLSPKTDTLPPKTVPPQPPRRKVTRQVEAQPAPKPQHQTLTRKPAPAPIVAAQAKATNKLLRPREPAPDPSNKEVEEATILQAAKPETAPEPRQPADSSARNETRRVDDNALARYENLLLTWLERYKYYPRRARRLRIEGEGRLRIRIDSEGRAIKLELERSTGNRLLDRAALDMARKAAPYPPPPVSDGELEFIIPVVYALR